MEVAEFKTTHGLDFEVCWETNYGFYAFRVGTCHGLWGVDENSFLILAIYNDQPGNGHTKDVFEWFEYSCRRDGKSLKVLEVMNEEFKKSLIEKHGFMAIDADNVEKHFS